MNDYMAIKGIKPTVFFVKKEGRLLQKADLMILNQGLQTSCTINAIIESQEITQDLGPVPIGEHNLEIFIPDILNEAQLEIAIISGNEVLDRYATYWKPQKKWEVCFIPITHHDLGYTEPIDTLMDSYDKYYDDVISYCEITDSFPEESRYRYTVENTWSLEHYIKNRPADKVEKLFKYIGEGRIEVSAFYANVTDVQCGQEELIRCLYPAFGLKRKYGIPVDTACIVDIPGMSWGLPKILANAGIRYFFAGFPTYFEWEDIYGVHDVKKVHSFWDEDKILRHGIPDAFIWKGQDGSSILVYYQGGYGHFLGGTPDTTDTPNTIDIVMDRLPGQLEEIQKNGSPFSVVRYIDHGVDNFPPKINISCIVDEWNKRFEYPKLEVATNRMFFEKLEKQCSDLRVFKGELPHTDYNVAGTSFAYETGMNYISHAMINSAEKLLTAAHVLTGSHYPVQRINSVYEDMLLYDEHCFGMSKSFGKVYDWNWSSKRHYAYRASSNAEAMMAGAADVLAKAVKGEDGSHYICVFNPLSFEVSDIVRVTNFTFILDEDFELIDEITGSKVEYQRNVIDDPNLPVPYASHRYVMHEMGGREGVYANEIVFKADNVPTMGYKTYRIEATGNKYFGQNISKKEQHIMENSFYRIELDKKTGAVASIYDKELKKEIVDFNSPHKLNQVIVKNVRDRKEENTQNASIRTRNEGCVYKSIIVHTGCTGCPEISQEIILYNRVKRIDIANRILKDSLPLQEIYIAFPFNVENPKFKYEGNHCIAEPFKDQLPGSNTHYYSVQNWAQVYNDSLSIVLSPIEAHVIEFGGIWPCYVSQAHHAVHPDDFGREFIKPEDVTKGYMYSFIMYNNFRTNFSSSQNGDMLFRYAITSNKNESPVNFGWCTGNPLVPVCFKGQGDGMLDKSISFCVIDKDNIVLLNMKKAEDGRGIILRFIETEGRSCTFRVRLPYLDIMGAFRTSIVEEDREMAEYRGDTVELAVKAYGIETIRVIPENKM